ncbi:CoA transferase subunit A [Alteribacillus sp. JSM 102045]|uniref:CoA transferase subunit A n=1 Tax=Alteribacillus sp. JSM 102045 TaxID=1562101 RepID=UPI0035BF4686
MSKVTSLRDAVSRNIYDGDLVYTSGWQGNVPYSASHEIIRQNKLIKLISGASCEIGDHLIAAGCVDEVYLSWIGNDATKGSHAIRRALKGIPRKLKIHDFNNMTIVSMLLGGYYGFPFVPVKGMVGSDLIEYNEIIRYTDNPFSEKDEETPVVPGIQPDVAILHVQRADEFGNVHRWGALSLDEIAGMAAKRVILTCEELVSAEIIRNDPNRTMLPGLKITSVVHEPWGAHPSHMPGFYQSDWDYRINVSGAASRQQESHEAFLKEWVYNIEDRNDYIEYYVKKFGYSKIEDLRLKEPILSSSINYGWR